MSMQRSKRSNKVFYKEALAPPILCTCISGCHWCRQRRQATAGNGSQASDRRIFNTVNTLDLMRTSTEFISEISAPTISTSFKFHHLDFLVNLGEVDVHHICMCFIVSIPCHASPSILHDA